MKGLALLLGIFNNLKSIMQFDNDINRCRARWYSAWCHSVTFLRQLHGFRKYLAFWWFGCQAARPPEWYCYQQNLALFRQYHENWKASCILIGQIKEQANNWEWRVRWRQDWWPSTYGDSWVVHWFPRCVSRWHTNEFASDGNPQHPIKAPPCHKIESQKSFP